MQKNTSRNLWVDYLRSSLTVLVVAHHSTLAYTTFASFDKVAYIRSTHPIVDSKRWVGLDIFENFNDVFFMSLMFLIGGLFLTRSIERKGTWDFIKDRIYRLLIPFLFLGTLLMLMAYFPAYVIAHNSSNVIDYVKDFFWVEQWPVGPPWFIWVLFVFNLVFVFNYVPAKKTLDKLAIQLSNFKTRPGLFLICFFVFTWILYVPVAYSIGAGTWTGVGPFDFQLSRILWYFGYFMLGVVIGNSDFNQEIFSEKMSLVRQWKMWVAWAAIAYCMLTLNGELGILSGMVKTSQIREFTAWMIYYSLYVASCTLSCLAFVTTFRSRISVPKLWWDSLSENAYLIYLVHFVFVTWIQFSLLSINIPAFFKFMLTFTGSLALSWGVSIMLRKIKIIHKYL